MKCTKAQEWINLQMDGQLPARHVPLLQDHLGACAACRHYCDDLLVGRRLLQAPVAELSEHFEWNLQLRLNQVIREAAREISFPSRNPHAGLRRWLMRASLAFATGLAAVLAVAVLLPGRTDLLPPAGRPVAAEVGRSSRLPVKSDDVYGLFAGNRRRPLDAPYRALASSPDARGLQRQASLGSLGARANWTTMAEDHGVHRIRSLERDLEALRRHLEVRDRRIQTLEARLDSLRALAVDTARE